MEMCGQPDPLFSTVQRKENKSKPVAKTFFLNIIPKLYIIYIVQCLVLVLHFH